MSFSFRPTVSAILLLFCTGVIPCALAQQRPANCTQIFNFVCKTQFDDLFWIVEHRAGECNNSTLLQVLIEPKKRKTPGSKELYEPKAIPLVFRDYNDMRWVESSRGYLRTEMFEELQQKGNAFEDPQTKLSIKPPRYNRHQHNLYVEQFANACGEEWNDVNEQAGVDPPRISGKNECCVVYWHPKGLYINYEISRVLFFPDTNYLVVFTTNEIRCTGNNTMDGFLILKLAE